MNNQKIKTVCQSTLLMKQQQHSLIQYAHIFNNHVFIYETHINFNGNNINNDRNSKTQFVIFTNDGAYLFIAMSQPNAISVLNTRTGDILVARGLEQICNQKIIAFSMQPEEHISNQRKGKKLYLLYEIRGSLMLKLIQIQNQIDNNPKTRTKVIQQNIYQGSNIFRFQPIFCNLSWNTFIIFKKEFRVFMIKKEGQQLGMNFAVQSFQSNLLRLTSSFNVLGFAQSAQTWAILCGNPINSRNTSQLSLNIFWQHKQSQSLCRNLYYLDNSFIKSISLPINQEQYVRIWQINGYYLIQSRNKRNGVHKCCIVHQDQNSGSIITINLLQGSQLCQHTLEITPQQISVCQIKNKFQLYETKIYGKEVEKEENIPSNYPNTNSTRANTQINNSDDIQRNKSNQSIQNVRTEQNIKKFTPTNQTVVSPQIKDRVGQTKLDQTKVLGRQIQKKETTVPAITTFINEKIVQHLNKNQKKGNESDAEIQAPNSVQRLASFGAPNNLTQQKKPQNHNISFGSANDTLKQNAVVSFGAPKLTPDAQIAEKSSTAQNVVQKEKPKDATVQSDDQINEKIKNHKDKYSKVKVQIQKMQENLCKQLENKKQSLKENYLTVSQSLKMSLETIFTASEQQNIKKQFSCLGQFTPFISRQKKKNEIIDIKIKNTQLFIQQCKQLLNKFGLWKQSQQSQLVSFRKLIKSTKKETSLESKILSNLEIVKDSFLKLQKDTNLAYNMWKQKENQRLKVKKQCEKAKKISMKQIFHLIHREKIRQTNKKQKILKIPISKVEWIRQNRPQIILSPLQ